MKKIFFLSMAAIAVVSCSSDKEEIVTEGKLVEATITAETAETLTRAYLGHIDHQDGHQETGVKFQLGDQMDVYEYCSYANGTSYIFTCKDLGNFQSPNFKGFWSEDRSAWTAIFPSSSNNQMISMTDGDVDYGENLYQFVIPQNQETITSPDGGVTYKNEANVMVAARYKKERVETPTCFLSPVVAYLYFASDQPVVSITSSAGPICGTAQCKTTINTWANWSFFANHCESITGLETNAKTIQSTGIYTTRSSKYEHIVCLLPGTFEAGQLVIGTKSNTEKHELKHVNMYYLGSID